MSRTGLTTAGRTLVLWLLVFVPAGCRQNAGASTSNAAPIVRVRLFQNLDHVLLTAAQPPVVQASTSNAAHRLNVPGGSNVEIRLIPGGGWQAGGVNLGGGEELHIRPAFPGGLRVNNLAHRGTYRLVAVAPGKFDVINDVDLESYLKGVIAREVLSGWDIEAFKAQAIAARTYALYEVASTANRYWHVYADTRSQVYGGIPAETGKAVQAVDETAGVVLAYGPAGREKIFKAYFSACCGGIGQSAADALGEPDIPPLMERNVGANCNASPRFNWPPVVMRKDELTRRVRSWGVRRGRAEKDVAAIARIEIAQSNRFGRPVRFTVTDARGAQYSLGSEEMRWAINADANGGPTVLSSFFKPVNESETIQFVDGHGWGHGVGLCQWCAQSWASRGVRHEDILRASYPGSIFVRAY